jgi:mRNA-degrading endonuclease toxin of MazEF toxin-antitoxin module
MMKRVPLRGEIWFTQFHVDPPGKGRRPVIIVSTDTRNRHERAETVLIVPLTTSVHKEIPTHVYLTAAETGLSEDSAARAEDISVVRKQSLVEPRRGLRQVSEKRICEIAAKVGIAAGCPPA